MRIPIRSGGVVMGKVARVRKPKPKSPEQVCRIGWEQLKRLNDAAITMAELLPLLGRFDDLASRTGMPSTFDAVQDVVQQIGDYVEKKIADLDLVLKPSESETKGDCPV